MIERMFFSMGWAMGFAAGMICHKQSSDKPKKMVMRMEDQLIAEYISDMSIVYCDDLIGYLGIDDNSGSRISVGHSMRKLGWIRRRGIGEDRRWYYERGADVGKGLAGAARIG